MIGLATAWVKSDEISKLLDTFQKMVLELVKRVLLPVLPVFIAANFCILSYQGAVTKQLPVFQYLPTIFSWVNSIRYNVFSSYAGSGVGMCPQKPYPSKRNQWCDDTFIRQYTPMRLYPDRNRICTHCIPNALWKYAQYITNYFIHPVMQKSK